MSLLDRLREKARQLKAEALTLWLAYGDARTPWSARLLIAVTLGYLFSPIDLIPDFIPILGLLDDLVLVPFLIHLSLRLIPPAVLADCRLRAEQEGVRRPVSWWFAGVIALLWALAAYGLYRLYLRLTT